jgi:hypothetical protein
MFGRVKKLLMLFILLLPLWGDHVRWQGEYNKAFQHAHDINRSLLVLVVKEGEARCHEVIRESLMNQPYVEQINQQMIAVMVTYEGALSYPIELYYTTVFPTLFFVDSQRETFIGEPLYGDEINATSIKNHLNQYSILHN